MQTTDQVKSVAGQEWIDMAMQVCGDEQRLFELADANNVGITDVLPAGTIIKTLTPDFDKKRIVGVLATRKPSSIYYGVGDPAPEGIENWAIELDFEVS